MRWLLYALIVFAAAALGSRYGWPVIPAILIGAAAAVLGTKWDKL